MSDIEKRARELPIVARLYERRTARCTYRRASVASAEGEPLVRLDDVLSMISALTPPDGFALVPVEPTESMIAAAEEAHMPFGDMGFAISAAIDARPEVP